VAHVIALEVVRFVHAIGENENDAPAVLPHQRVHGNVDGVPEGRRARRLQLAAKDANQFFVVAREIFRIHLNPCGETAKADLVLRQQTADERLGARLNQLEVLLHAGAAVEHHHERDGLNVTREKRDRLRLPVVVDLEILLREVGDQSAV